MSDDPYTMSFLVKNKGLVAIDGMELDIRLDELGKKEGESFTVEELVDAAKHAAFSPKQGGVILENLTDHELASVAHKVYKRLRKLGNAPEPSQTTVPPMDVSQVGDREG